MCKLLCKPKDHVATEDKNNSVYEIAKHCWEADHNFNWDQKIVIDRESRLILRKIEGLLFYNIKNGERKF